jgi:hypothetical protein
VEDVESLAETWRSRLRIAGAPETRDVWKLVEGLGVPVEREGEVACLARYPDGSVRILLPPGLDRERELLEEAAHFAVGEPEWNASAWGNGEWRRRAFLRGDDREEELARAFALCWLVPCAVMRAYHDPEDIARECNVTIAEVNARLRLAIGRR